MAEATRYSFRISQSCLEVPFSLRFACLELVKKNLLAHERIYFVSLDALISPKPHYLFNITFFSPPIPFEALAIFCDCLEKSQSQINRIREIYEKTNRQ